jgi:hypothetical protein
MALRVRWVRRAEGEVVFGGVNEGLVEVENEEGVAHARLAGLPGALRTAWKLRTEKNAQSGVKKSAIDSHVLRKRITQKETLRRAGTYDYDP